MKIKRIYETPEAEDGYRVLVDRIWPRGISKDNAALDEWMKDIAPSTELRKWFNHQPELFPEFKSAKKILMYWSTTDELPTHKFVEKWSVEKEILLPSVVGDDIVIKKYSA